MGYMEEGKVIEFLDALVEKLAPIAEKYDIYDEFGEVRYDNKIGWLSSMLEYGFSKDSFEEADCSIAEFTADEYCDIYLSCEGTVYEAVYRYSASGGDAMKKELYDAFMDTNADFDMLMEFDDGAFRFTSDESWKRQNEE